MATVKTYNIDTMQTLKVYTNFDLEGKIAMFLTKDAIDAKKVKFSRTSESGTTRPVLRMKGNYKLIDPSYDTPFSLEEYNTAWLDYFAFISSRLPDNLSDYEIILYMQFDENKTAADLTLSNDAPAYSNTIYMYRDHRGVTQPLGQGGIILKHKVTGDIIETERGSYGVYGTDSKGRTITDPFIAALTGEPNYRTVQELYGVMEISSNIDKVFSTRENAMIYADTGEEIGRLDGDDEPEEPAEDRLKTLFYNSTVFSRLYNDSVVNRVGPSSINIQIQYKTNEGEVLINPNRAICGYVNTDYEPNNTTYFGNIHWLVKQGVKIIETNTNRISGASSTYVGNIPSWDESTGFNGTYIDGNTIYESKYNTNMYIFANRADAEAYLAGQDPKPIGGGSGGFNPDGFIGDETSYNIQTNDVTNDMSSCWILSKAQLNELALIFSTGVNYVADDAGEQLGAVIESSMRSFIAHGEPVDMVCDLFYLPINPTEFANASAGQIEIARDQMSLLGTAQEIQDEFGNNYSVKKSIGLDIALGPAASAAYTLGEIKDAVSSVIGSGETSNKFNVRNTNMQ